MERTKTDKASEANERKAYEPPRIVYREPLEAVATACGASPAKGDPGSCPLGPISS